MINAQKAHMKAAHAETPSKLSSKCYAPALKRNNVEIGRTILLFVTTKYLVRLKSNNYC